MEKIKAFILKSNFALLGFIAFATRLVAVGTSFSDALALLAFTGLYAYDKWLHLQTDNVIAADEKFKTDTINDLANIKSAISAVKLGQAYNPGLRRVNNGNQGQ